MEDKGLYAICALFNKSKTLIQLEEDIEPKMKLDIGSNSFTSRAFGRLIEYIENFHGLNSLTISSCKLLTQYDLIGLGEALKNNFSLLYLDIQDLPLNRDVFDAFIRSLQENYVLACIKVSFNSDLISALIKHADVLKSIFSLQTPE